MERRLSDRAVTFKRRRRSGAAADDAAYGSSATHLVSCAPSQHPAAGTAPPLASLPPPPPLRRPRPTDAKPWGLTAAELQHYAEIDSELLLESYSRQTTPDASRAASAAASPHAGAATLPGPCTAPQHGADLAAVITQRLGTPGSEEIRRHYPRVQVSRGVRFDRRGAG